MEMIMLMPKKNRETNKIDGVILIEFYVRLVQQIYIQTKIFVNYDS